MYHDSPDAMTTRTLLLTPRDIKDAERLLSLLAGAVGELDAGQSRSGHHASQGDAPTDSKSVIASRVKLRTRAAELLKFARQRQKFLPREMFGEAPWEILITLYITESRFSIGRLGDHAGVAMTSAIRWVSFLEKENLVARDSHPTDMRRVLIELTEHGRNLLDMYLSETLTTKT